MERKGTRERERERKREREIIRAKLNDRNSEKQIHWSRSKID